MLFPVFLTEVNGNSILSGVQIDNFEVILNSPLSLKCSTTKLSTHLFGFTFKIVYNQITFHYLHCYQSGPSHHIYWSDDYKASGLPISVLSSSFYSQCNNHIDPIKIVQIITLLCSKASYFIVRKIQRHYNDLKVYNITPSPSTFPLTHHIMIFF